MLLLNKVYANFFLILSFSFNSVYAFDLDTAITDWDKTNGQPFKERQLKLNHIIRQATAEKNFSSLADVYRRMGTLYKDELKLDSAMCFYLRSAVLADSIGYNYSYASSCNQVGTLFYEVLSLNKAMNYFKMAFNAYKKENDNRGIADAGYNIGRTYSEIKQFDSALYYCNLSMQYQRKVASADSIALAANYDLLADIAFRQHNFVQAIVYTQKALSLFEAGGDDKMYINALLQAGAEKIQVRDYKSALTSFKEAFQLASELHFRRHIIEAAGSLAEIYELQRSSDSSLFYLKIYSNYKNTLLNELSLITSIETATRYETEKKDLEITQQQQRSLYMSRQLIVLSILSVVLLLTLLLLLRNIRQRKKIRQKEWELNNSNAMLQGQDVERERIARELHDNVGSMLSTVKLHFTSMEEHMDHMLKQQGKSYEKAINLLDETYEEVRRISHDLDTGLLSRFGFKTAMLQLVQLIESTNKMKVLYIDNNLEPALYKTFETDLYRITQELLSNTIKYASAKEISIQLSISQKNLVYSYEDDGVGFNKEKLEQAAGIGYKNIDGRVKKMKGSWHLDTSPGHGTNVIIEIPLHGSH